MTVVPRMYGTLLFGMVFLVTVVLGWAFFGSINETTTVTGIWHPTETEAGEVIAFVPLTTGKSLEPGMRASVTLTGFKPQQTGSMLASIAAVDEDVTGVEEMREILQDDLLISTFANNGPVMKVVFSVEKDPASENGYLWTHEGGRSIRIHDFTYARLTVTEATRRPITLGMSGLAELFHNQ
ncbi:MAG: hypothetical protein II868_03960 [Butyrivibrio sp.]|nr:hypothetical protein [Butyrivibrio sp.]